MSDAEGLFFSSIVRHLTAFVEQNESNEKFTSSIWGPTCDGLDCIQKSIEMPKLNVGDWLLWKNMGAYTISAAVEFNGLPYGKPIYFMSKQFWYDVIRSLEDKQLDVSILGIR